MLLEPITTLLQHYLGFLLQAGSGRDQEHFKKQERGSTSNEGFKVQVFSFFLPFSLLVKSSYFLFACLFVRVDFSLLNSVFLCCDLTQGHKGKIP
jgi:hypothetical protein